MALPSPTVQPLGPGAVCTARVLSPAGYWTHRNGGLTQCLLTAPAEGLLTSDALASPGLWNVHWLSLSLELRRAPEDAGEQALGTSGGKDTEHWLLPQEEKTG